LIYILFALALIVIILTYYCLKFAIIIVKMQETIEDSLDRIDDCYKRISEINDIPVFFDSPEIRRLLAEIENVKFVILRIANKLSNSSISLEDQEEEESWKVYKLPQIKKVDAKKSKKNKKKKSNYYFTAETQMKIVEYQKADRKIVKDRLYENHIQPAFKELVHNLVSVYGFKSTNEDIYHLKSDCVTFLFETIKKWNPDNGTKAFSYFNVVAKNWLTIHSRRLLKNSQRSVSFECPEEFTFIERSRLADIEIDDSAEEQERKENQPKIMKGIISHIKCNLKDERDIRCIDAISQVFSNIDNLDYLNKRAVFVYLREISGLNSGELSSSLSTIRKHFKKHVGNTNCLENFFWERLF